MAATTATLEKRTRLEDVLEHLPISGTAQYRKGQRIYGPDAVSKSIYLVVTGTVGISQIAEDGRELLLELVRPDELFGESAFIEDPSRFEKAMAIERAELMSWAVSDMEALVVRRPPLALALLQFLAQRNASLTRRIESLSIDTVERRSNPGNVSGFPPLPPIPRPRPAPGGMAPGGMPPAGGMGIGQALGHLGQVERRPEIVASQD